MRQIKFRAKVVEHNPQTNPDDGWVDGFYYQDLYKGEMKHFIKNSEMVWEVKPETIGQFTGLHDCNGTEIYEGDIILDDGVEYLVKWGEEFSACYKCKYYHLHYQECTMPNPLDCKEDRMELTDFICEIDNAKMYAPRKITRLTAKKDIIANCDRPMKSVAEGCKNYRGI